MTQTAHSTPTAQTARAAPTQTAASTLDLLERSRHSLLEACHSREVSQRYLQAQLAALRAAAALVAARSGPSGQPGPRSLWDLVSSVAPELTEWAGFFAVSTRRRAHIEGGQRVVSARDADDLIRQAETFVDLVCRTLGLPAPPHGDQLFPTAPCPVERA
jgi:SAV_6107-like HEPN